MMCELLVEKEGKLEVESSASQGSDRHNVNLL